MKIVSCIKRVPVVSRVRLLPDGRGLDLKDVPFRYSDSDSAALEEALRIKEAQGGEVILLSLGPSEAIEEVRKGLARGADRGIILVDPQWMDRDSRATSKALAERIALLNPDLVLMGSASEDQESSAIGPIVATYLGWSCVTEAIELVLEGREGTTRRVGRTEIGVETIVFNLPAVVTCSAAINTPRYSSLKGIFAAKRKTIERAPCEDCSRQGYLQRMELRPQSVRKQRVLGGDTAVRDLVRALEREAGVLGQD